MKIIRQLRRSFAKISYALFAACQVAFFAAEYPSLEPYGLVSMATSTIAFAICLFGIYAVCKRNKHMEINAASAGIFIHIYGSFLLGMEVLAGMDSYKYAVSLFLHSLLPLTYFIYRRNYLIERIKNEKTIEEITNKQQLEAKK